MILFKSPCEYSLVKGLLLLVFIFLWYRALFNVDPRVIIIMPDYKEHNIKNSKICNVKNRELQLVKIDFDEKIELNNFIKVNNEIKIGGEWKPKDCKSLQRVAIILPYRNRKKHLNIFLKRIHTMMQRQKIHYRIFVVSQSNTNAFNRGFLLNIGALQTMKRMNPDCLIFHDVDLIPEHDGNLYMCGENDIRQLTSSIDHSRYHVIFNNYAGGVAALTKRNFIKTNGFPNIYWGWGNEDDDFSARTIDAGLFLTRPPEYIGRYKMAKHKHDHVSMDGNSLFLSYRGRAKFDGINSIMEIKENKINSSSPFTQRYQLLNVTNTQLYTNISVELFRTNINQTTINEYHTQESLIWFLKFYGYI